MRHVTLTDEQYETVMVALRERHEAAAEDAADTSTDMEADRAANAARSADVYAAMAQLAQARRLSETQALDAIHEILSGREWAGADDMPAIADIVEATGRQVLPPADDEPGEISAASRPWYFDLSGDATETVVIDLENMTAEQRRAAASVAIGLDVDVKRVEVAWIGPGENRPEDNGMCYVAASGGQPVPVPVTCVTVGYRETVPGRRERHGLPSREGGAS